MKKLAILLVALIALSPAPLDSHDSVYELAVRDNLIVRQENLLDTYRCMFDIDTELVEVGCANGRPKRLMPVPSVPSRPPTVSDEVGGEPLPTPSAGSPPVPVFFCVGGSWPSQREMTETVGDLNTVIGGFFDRESSGMADVRFTLGGKVSPPGVNWGQGTMEDVWDAEAVPGPSGFHPCNDAAWAESQTSQMLIVVDLPPSDATAGFAGTGTGPTFLTSRDLRSNWKLPFFVAAAHEMGHALFSWHHSDQGGHCQAWSLMNSRLGGCERWGTGTTLGHFHIACFQRQSAGWPC